MMHPEPTSYPSSFSLFLHDALPILLQPIQLCENGLAAEVCLSGLGGGEILATFIELGEFGNRFSGHRHIDWKSTRLNSSHRCSSYAVFCLKKTMMSRTSSARSATV